MATFRALRALTGDNPYKLCIPGEPVLDRPIRENTIYAALRMLGFGQEEMSAHGFRALASSLPYEESELSSEVIERAMPHQDQTARRPACVCT